MQDNTQQNTGSKWWQQEAFSEQHLQRPDATERTGKQSYAEEAGEDAASLLAEELRRKDAHIARLEAMLRQAEASPTEHERRPEAFLPLYAPEHTAQPSETMAAPSSGAMGYDSPPVVPENAAGGTNHMAAGSTNRVGGAMVYDAPPVAPRTTPLRLEDMKLEHSPIAQMVMQTAARRLSEPVPVFEPTLRMPAQATRKPGSSRGVRDSRVRRRQLIVVGALASLAFAGVIGASQLRAPRSEPMLIAPPPAIAATTFAAAPVAAPVKVSKPYAASMMRTTDFSQSSIEILPVTPAPQTIKRSARHTGSAHIAAVSTSSSPDPEPSPPSSHTVRIMQYPVRAVHTVQPRVHTAASTANIRKSAEPSFQAETSGVIVEADGERPRVPSAFRSDTSSPSDRAEADASSHSTEVLSDDTRDTYGESRASDYRARRRRGYRYSQAEASETRRSAYKYGENTNRRSDDDAEFARRSTRGYNEKTDERNDAWTDGRPDR